jgi:N-acetylmuramoyl-L-alanine amidase
MPATKLIKIRVAVMQQNTKIRGLKDILTAVVMMASIIMPLNGWSQPGTAEKQWVVVIDAGHGGRDPGTHGAKTKEKDINLSVALKTGKYISEYLKNVKVIYTRDDDTFIELDERAAVANRNKADIFISIHSNWISDKRVTGAETWVLGQIKDEANLQLVMKENSVITFEEDYQTKYEGYDPNSVESFIIFSLMQNTYLKQSTEFASLIQKQFKERVGRRDRGLKQGPIIVLWRTTMPSVLVELGYVSNSEEEKFLMSEQGQDYLASAIFRAFREYKQLIDSRSGLENGIARAQSTSAVSAEANSSGEKEAEVIQTNTAARVAESFSGQPAGQNTASQAAEGDQVFFMVQISAVPRDREMSKGELSGITEITMIDDGDRIKYAAGKFNVYDEAVEYRRTLTAKFPDAFVIAVKNGSIMPLKEAIAAAKIK